MHVAWLHLFARFAVDVAAVLGLYCRRANNSVLRHHHAGGVPEAVRRGQERVQGRRELRLVGENRVLPVRA